MVDEKKSGITDAEAFIALESRYMLPVLLPGMQVMFKKGEWWTASSENIVTYDPSAFKREGMDFTPVQQLFALCHELYAHLHEWRELRKTQEGEELFQQRLSTEAENPQIAEWENIREDLRGNRGLLTFPIFSDESAVPALYTQKLFPDSAKKNMRQLPKHLQFMDAILLEYMLTPEEFEKVEIDDDVRKIIADLHDGLLPSGEEVLDPQTKEPLGDAIDAMTDQGLTSALESIRISKAIFWPIVNSLYQQDIRERRVGYRANPFKREYEEQQQRHVTGPHSDSDEQKMEKGSRSQYSSGSAGGKGGDGLGERQQGRTPFEAAYQETSPYVTRLIQILKNTIDQPIVYIRKRIISRNQQADGELDDLIEAYLALRRRGGGSEDLPIFAEDRIVEEREAIIQQEFAPLDFYLVVDTTGSMGGEKIAKAATVALLIARAAVERKKVATTAGIKVPETQMSVHTFDTRSQIALSLRDATSLSRKDLEQLFTAINGSGGSNNEPQIFQTLVQDLQIHQPSADAPRKRIVFIITDGGASGISEAKAKLKEIKDTQHVRVIPIGIGIDFNDFHELYGNDAQQAESLEDILRIVASVLNEEMEAASKPLKIEGKN